MSDRNQINKKRATAWYTCSILAIKTGWVVLTPGARIAVHQTAALQDTSGCNQRTRTSLYQKKESRKLVLPANRENPLSFARIESKNASATRTVVQAQLRHRYDEVSHVTPQCRSQQRSTGLQTRGIFKHRNFFAIPRSPQGAYLCQRPLPLRLGNPK